MILNFYSIALLISTAVSILIAIYAWRRRPAPGAAALILFMAGAAIWSFGYAFELASLNLDTKIFWAKVQYLGIVTVPLMVLIIAIEYSGRENWLTPRNLGILSLEPLIIIILVWTNELHGLVWREIYIIDDGLFALGLAYGPGFWINVIYSYLLLLASVILLLQTFFRPSQFYRAQVGVMLLSIMFPWIANALYQLDLNPFPGLDLTPFAFTLTGVGVAWGLFRLKLMEISPIAHYAVFENMSDSVIVLDAQQRIVDINPAGRLLLSQAEHRIIGKPLDQMLPEWVEIRKRSSGETEFEEEITLGNGHRTKSFDLIISPLFNRRQVNKGQIIVFRDITARKKMESELVIKRDQALEAERFKSQILANVSHDMRTPLGAIVGYTEMVRDGLFGPVTDQQHARLNLVLESGNQLSDFVDNLLEQSEISSGDIVLRREPVSPEKLIWEALTTNNILIEQKSLEIITEVDPQAPSPLIGDHYWLRRILSNLIHNATKFTEKGKITIRIFKQDAMHWGIQVSDTGIGITESAKEEIFEPFRKGGQSVSGDHGSGLGLSIVREIVARMDGKIELVSDLGIGSTFTIILPILEEVVIL